MSGPNIDDYRVILERELEELKDQIARTRAAAATVKLDQSSVGRLSRMDALQQQAMAQRMQERLNIRRRKLDAARARIDQGTFGQCCQCGDGIEASRIQRDIAVLFCRTCMEERSAPGQI